MKMLFCLCTGKNKSQRLWLHAFMIHTFFFVYLESPACHLYPTNSSSCFKTQFYSVFLLMCPLTTAELNSPIIFMHIFLLELSQYHNFFCMVESSLLTVKVNWSRALLIFISLTHSTISDIEQVLNKWFSHYWKV